VLAGATYLTNYSFVGSSTCRRFPTSGRCA
jgi:hypothetical protein